MKRRVFCAFLTVIIAITIFSTSAFAYTGVDSYFASEIASADKLGLIPDDLGIANLKRDITRSEFCNIAMNTYKTILGEYMPKNTDYFVDTNNVDINAAFELSIVSGVGNGNFAPERSITRQEMFKMMYSLMNAVGVKKNMSEDEAVEYIIPYDDSEDVQSWAIVPAALMIETGITRGTSTKTIGAKTSTSRAQAIVLSYRFYDILKKEIQPSAKDEVPTDTSDNQQIEVEYQEQTQESISDNVKEISQEMSDVLFQQGYSDEKYAFIFESVDKPKYQTEEEAKSKMIEITVPVWRVSSSGEKIASTKDIVVNIAISDIVLNIFTEIYNGGEKFPIYEIGGYAWRGNGVSEHNWGIAIDINPNENYMIKGDEIQAGELWEPEINIYSITPNGDVVNAFKKYGFSWGGDAWVSRRDYMHFSYLGQ